MIWFEHHYSDCKLSGSQIAFDTVESVPRKGLTAWVKAMVP